MEKEKNVKLQAKKKMLNSAHTQPNKTHSRMKHDSITSTQKRREKEGERERSHTKAREYSACESRKYLECWRRPVSSCLVFFGGNN